jgi:uncharacterized membrane protein
MSTFMSTNSNHTNRAPSIHTANLHITSMTINDQTFAVSIVSYKILAIFGLDVVRLTLPIISIITTIQQICDSEVINASHVIISTSSL